MSSILTALFVLALSFLYNEVDAKIYCKTEKIEDINKITVNDKFFEGLSKLKPNYKRVEKDMYDKPKCEITSMPLLDEFGQPMLDENEQPAFHDVVTNQPCCMGAACNFESYYIDDLIDENDSRTYYDRLFIDSKPAITEFETILNSWKAKKIADINWERRVCDLPEKDRLARKCGFNKSNFSKHLHKLINGQDKPAFVSFVECMEGKQAEVSAEDSAREAKKTELNQAKDYIKSLDCTQLSGPFHKAVCTILKR